MTNPTSPAAGHVHAGLIDIYILEVKIETARSAYQSAAERVCDAERALEAALAARLEAGQHVGRLEAQAAAS